MVLLICLLMVKELLKPYYLLVVARCRTNGKFNLFAGTGQTPSLTITDDDLLQTYSNIYKTTDR